MKRYNPNNPYIMGEPFSRKLWIGLIFVGVITLLIAAGNAFADGEACYNCNEVTSDAVEGAPVYSDPGQFMAETTTQGFPIPEGFKMVSMPQPPRLVCTQYPVPDKWEMVEIAPPPVQAQPVTVGADNVEAITIITGE